MLAPMDAITCPEEIAAAKSRGWPEWWTSPRTAGIETSKNCSLLQLPEELLLCIFDSVEDWIDRVSLCEACPRSGKRALETLLKYQDPMFGIVQYLKHRGRYALDDRLLRKYASLREANVEGVAWLQTFAANIGLDNDDIPILGMPCLVVKDGAKRFSINNRKKLRSGVGWFLSTLTSTGCACENSLSIVRHVNGKGLIVLFEGFCGSERMTSALFLNGSSHQYIGPRGHERLYRVNFPNGRVDHYRGNPNNEHLFAVEDVKCNCKEMPITKHYVGPRRSERLVRIDCHYDGTSEIYVGKRNQEIFYQRRDQDGGVTSYALTDNVDEEGRHYFAKRHYVSPNGIEIVYDGSYNKLRRLAIKYKDGAIEYMAGKK